jgi:hypothetical protein
MSGPWSLLPIALPTAASEPGTDMWTSWPCRMAADAAETADSKAACLLAYLFAIALSCDDRVFGKTHF